MLCDIQQSTTRTETASTGSGKTKQPGWLSKCNVKPCICFLVSVSWKIQRRAATSLPRAGDAPFSAGSHLPCRGGLTAIHHLCLLVSPELSSQETLGRDANFSLLVIYSACQFTLTVHFCVAVMAWINGLLLYENNFRFSALWLTFCLRTRLPLAIYYRSNIIPVQLAWTWLDLAWTQSGV